MKRKLTYIILSIIIIALVFEIIATIVTAPTKAENNKYLSCTKKLNDNTNRITTFYFRNEKVYEQIIKEVTNGPITDEIKNEFDEGKNAISHDLKGIMNNYWYTDDEAIKTTIYSYYYMTKEEKNSNKDYGQTYQKFYNKKRNKIKEIMQSDNLTICN